jgi:hypothetical protein
MQEESRYKQFFDRLYYKVYNHGKRSGSSVLISANFTSNGSSEVVATKAKHVILNELRSIADYHEPEKIMVTLETGNVKKVYQEDFTKLALPPKQIPITAHSNSREKQDFSTQIQTIDRETSNMQPAINGFQGLGQLSVEDYINKKLEEERKDQKLKGLESELESRTQEVTRLNSIIEKLEQELEQGDKEKDELEGILESKKNIRYWAGLTGDILESFGLKKESLREPLAGLIASESGSDQKSLAANQTDDDSGIVEDTPDEGKRNELITLIGDYLQSVDNQTLANVFMIFSEIERDNSIATIILEHLQHQKQKEDANI